MKFADSTFRNKSIAFVGEFSHWPDHYIHSPTALAEAIGAQLTDTIDEHTDYLVGTRLTAHNSG